MGKNKKMVIIYLVCALVLPIIASLFLELLNFIGNYWNVQMISESFGLLIVNSITYLIPLIVIFNYYGTILKSQFKEEKDKLFKETLFYTFVFQAVTILVRIIINLFEHISASNQNSIDDMISYNWIFSIVLLGIISPIVEEIMFRYILFNYLERKTGKILGIVISSIVFALWHLGEVDFFVFVAYLVPGLFLGCVYIKKRNIVLNISVHCLYNIVNPILSILLTTGK